jgi:NAD+ diphosphatase
MHQPHPYRPNVFASSPLDRLDARRKDAAWIDKALQAETTAFLPVWRGRNLLTGGPAAPHIATLTGDLARAHLATSPWSLLGTHGEKILFAVDLSRLDQPLPEGFAARFEDLRRVAGLLQPQDASILAHARGLMHWRTRHRFCGVCGAACTPRDAGHVMVCTGCGADHFPRTDPAVIMLVTRTGADGIERALLGQPARFREMRVFTTLAGFVEPGESLEEAVAREVWEEAGVRVENVRYASSQPWPFPASIMLGFTAEATTEVIDFDPDELVEARWFTREEARAQDGFILPPDLSIARRLIDSWVGENVLF